MRREPYLGEAMVDIHCHLLPGIDDGASSLDVSLAMAKLAADDGIDIVIATPHQLGNFTRNTSDVVREAVRQLQSHLQQQHIPLRLLPGADVRIEADLTRRLDAGDVLTLGDHRKHLLLELPHELYFPLEPLLRSLAASGIVGILSHPERNQGLLTRRELVAQLVDAGCLMQITAGSLTGAFGAACQSFCRWMLRQGLVHFVATDAHGASSRRPLLRRAYHEVCRLTDQATAYELCAGFPRAVASGADVPAGRRQTAPRRKGGWFGNKKAG